MTTKLDDLPAALAMRYPADRVAATETPQLSELAERRELQAESLREERARLREEINRAERSLAEKFLGHFFRAHPIAPAPRAIASSRSGAAIAAEVKAFYRRRPRPWRWHGARA